MEIKFKDFVDCLCKKIKQISLFRLNIPATAGTLTLFSTFFFSSVTPCLNQRALALVRLLRCVLQSREIILPLGLLLGVTLWALITLYATVLLWAIVNSLQAVSLDADIPLIMVLRLASHLVHWGKAMAIYPLSENNIYITSPTADTRMNSEVSSQFSNRFPDQCLADVLSNFSLPVALGEIKDIFDDEKIVIWLLQHKQIVQLHTYVYIVPNETEMKSLSLINGKDDKNKKDTVKKLELLGHLNPLERACVLQTTAASNSDDLEEFAKLSQYFHGNHHLEGIMLIENIARSQLLTLIDKFSEILVTCALPEHSMLSLN